MSPKPCRAGNTASHPVFHLYAIGAQTGTVSWKAAIGGAPTNSPKQPFHANTQLQRPALLLAGGAVYAGFGSHCDHNPYVGYVARVDVSTHKTTLWTDEAGVINNRAGIWQAGGGLMADGPNRIFFASGNGVSPAPGKGSSPPGQLAESVVRLGVNSNGSLSARDFFSPKNAPALDAADHDLASGAPVGLPFGTTSLPNLLIQAGKTGNVFLLNRDGLGGREQGANKGDDTVAQAGPFGGQFGHVATFGDTPTLTSANNAGSNDYIYYLGKNDNLRALRFHLSSGSPVLSDVANSTFTFAFSSGSPVVTSNGTDPASAIVWVDSSSGSTGTKARLDAFDAMPQTVSGSLRMKMIWSAPIGTASKFTIPATDSGRVYIGTRDGHVLAFGSTAPAAPLTGGVPVTFAPLPVTTTSTPKTVTVTATKPVTVTGTSVGPSSFSAAAATETTPSDSTPVPVTFPVTLATGDALHVPVTYTPSAAGGAAGALTFATGSHRFPAIRVSLSGDGTSTGLYASPGALTFPLAPDQGVTLVPIGVGVPQTVDITNGGTTTADGRVGDPAVQPVHDPGHARPRHQDQAGALVRGRGHLPAQPGQSHRSSFTITNQDATSVTVHLYGSGTPSVSQLSASKTTVNFGSAPVGSTVTASVHITNTGNVPTVVKGTTALSAPFHAVFKVTKNMPFNPSYDLTVPVTFTPTKTGTFTAHYTLTWTDRLGTHTSPWCSPARAHDRTSRAVTGGRDRAWSRPPVCLPPSGQAAT